MSNQNMTLLSQNEIDTLVSFLTSKDSISTEVLSQNSIDKLVSLIQSKDAISLRGERTNMTYAQRLSKNIHASLSQEEIIANKNLELCFRLDEKKQFHLYTYNPVSKDEMELYPSSKNDTQNPGWGLCIMPLIFDQIATTYHLKYTTEVMEQICLQFASITYGDKDAEIADIYLPSGY